jgi:hypothetical protein
VHPFGCVGDHRAGGDDLGVVADRRERHRDDQLLSVPPPLAQVAPVDPLALRHALEAGEDVGRILLRAEQRDVTARDVLGAVTVDPLCPSVPAQDLPVEVEPDDRLGRVSLDGVQLAGVAPTLPFGATQVVGREPAQDRNREPDGQGDHRSNRVIDDEDEEERPTSRGDQRSPARPGGERDRSRDQQGQRSGGLRRGRVDHREWNRDGGHEHEAHQGHEPSVRSEPLGQQLGGRSRNCHLVRRGLLRARDREP